MTLFTLARFRRADLQERAAVFLSELQEQLAIDSDQRKKNAQ